MLACEGREGKRVILIRHAQSRQNVALARLRRGAVTAIDGAMDRDSAITPIGAAQIEHVRAHLEEGRLLIPLPPASVVASSPLARTTATAAGLFPGRRVVSLPQMQETSPAEKLVPRLLRPRTHSVVEWVHGRPESVCVLVGHGHFFRTLTRAAATLDNLAVVQYTLDGTRFTNETVLFPGFPSTPAGGGGEWK